MFNVTRRVSFSVVIALLLGWVAMSIMIFQSAHYSIAAETEDGYRIVIPRGVKLVLQVDKKVYRSEEPVLISLRNDSRLHIWLATEAYSCPATWWALQRLGTDGVEWQTVSRVKAGCGPTSRGVDRFVSHTLKTDEWNGLIQTPAVGEVWDAAPTGTYRIAVPYLVGKEVTEADWANDQQYIPTASFTIQ